MAHRRLPVEGSVEPLLDLRHRWAVPGRCVDGDHQAVLPRLRDRDDWMSCRVADEGRNTGCRPGHDQRGRRIVGGGDCSGFLCDEIVDYVVVLVVTSLELTTTTHRGGEAPRQRAKGL